jgi:hypothetical protein
MRVTRSQIHLVVAACLLAACRRGDSGSSDTLRTGDTAGSGRSATSPATTACGVGERTVVTGDGIGDLRVGAPVEGVTRTCRVVHDTVVQGAEGMPERRLVVDLGRDSVTVVVDSNRVWRVHVRSPAFRTADSLGVGTPATALRRPGARVLAGEGAHFVTLPSHCGLSFRLRGVEFGRVRIPAEIPDGATVGEVLVVGCRRGGG